MSGSSAPLAPPFRVALLSGACVSHDAISYSLRLKLDVLRSLARTGHDVDVRAFVQGTDLDDPDIRACSLHGLLIDPEFNRSNVFVYEYGIAYELFDSIFLLREGQRSVGIYHNVTPLDLVDWPEGRKRVKEGLLQRQNLGVLDHVACDSEFNRLDLVACGLPEKRLSVLSLPPLVSVTSPEEPDWNVNPIEVLFVGRFVKAKGVHDLLEAVALLGAEGESAFRLTLAGSARWAEPGTMQAARAAAGEGTSGVRTVFDPDDAALEHLYRESSILAIPSYHEGYCLPVLEAFHARCQVVASDAGNLPSIVGGLGQIVETGDVQGLARALRRAIAAARAAGTGPERARVPTADGDLKLADWVAAVAQHVERHSRERYDRSFLAILRGIGIDLGLDVGVASAA